MLTIKELRQGEQARILGFQITSSAYRHKLLAMGLTPGTLFTLARVAPLGDPIQIQVRGYALSLRKTEAMALLIEKA